jgi:hypothetical protein
MSFTLLGILSAQAAGGLAATYRLQTLGGDRSDWAYDVAVDSDFNSFLGGLLTTGPLNNYNFYVSKSDPEGTVLWQRYLSGTGNDPLAGVAVDSSGNIYITGESGFDSVADAFVTAKYSTDGALQWQKKLVGAQFYNSSPYALHIDSSDNLFVTGTTAYSTAGSTDALLAKYDTDGALQWQKMIGGSGTERPLGVNTDSSGNVYITGYTASYSSSNYLMLVKYNSAGTVQWQRVIGNAETSQGVDVDFDSSDNVYVAGSSRDSGGDPQRGWLVKYSSSGTVTWERYFSDASAYLNTISMTIDSDDNIYQLTSSDLADAGDKHLVWSKWDTSGNLVLQRRLGSTLEERAYKIRVDSENTLYLVGGTTGAGVTGWDMFLAVLPNDGSLTGTYTLDGVDYTYEATSFTASTPSHTAATSTLTAATGPLTAGDAILVSSTGSLTGYQVNL